MNTHLPRSMRYLARRYNHAPRACSRKHERGLPPPNRRLFDLLSAIGWWPRGTRA